MSIKKTVAILEVGIWKGLSPDVILMRSTLPDMRKKYG